MGSRIAVPRHTPGPIDLRSMPESDVIALELARLSHDPAGAPLPAALFSAPRSQVGLFLRHLWGAGGCISWDVDGESCVYCVYPEPPAG